METFDWQKTKVRLQKSKFRSRFQLSKRDIEYVEQKGLAAVREHSYEFIRKRLALAFPPNDGKQTPMRGHPVFIAQHATGTCCRKCLAKWHGIRAGHELSLQEIDYVSQIIMSWITDQIGG